MVHIFEEVKRLGAKTLRLYKVRNGLCTCGKLNCKSPGKHPAELHGYKDAKFRDTFDFTNYNLGIRTGGNLVVIDLDPRNGAMESEYIPRLRESGETLIVSTPSGGWHIYYETTLPIRKHILDKGIDIQGEGAYVVGPQSNHVSGDYKIVTHAPIALIPEWLLEELYTPNQQNNIVSNVIPLEPKTYDEDVKAKIESALDAIPPDTDYQEWIKVGMALHSVDGFNLWNAWSSKGSKYDPGTMQAKWNSFAGSNVSLESVYWIASQHGWTENFNDPVPREMKELFDSWNKKPEPVVVPADSPPEPSPLPMPDGLMGDLAKGFLDSCSKVSHNAAISLAQFTVASLFQDKFLAPTGHTVGMYLLHIGVQGCGKSYGQKLAVNMIKEIQGRTEPPPWGASANGLMMIFDHFDGNVTLYKDELIGNFRRMLKIDNGLRELLLEAWSSSHDLASQMASAKEYQFKAVDGGIGCSLLGAGTPKDWDDLLTGDQFFNSGWGSRLEVVEYPVQQSLEQRFLPYPERLRDRLENLHSVYSVYNIQGRPQLDISKEADAFLKEDNAETIERANQLHTHDDERGVIARRGELILRAACRLAIANHPYRPGVVPNVSLKDVQWAKHWIDYTQGIMRVNVKSDNSYESMFRQRIVNLLAEDRRIQTGLSKTDIFRYAGKRFTKNLPLHVRRDILNDMLESGILYHPTAKGAKMYCYNLTATTIRPEIDSSPR